MFLSTYHLTTLASAFVTGGVILGILFVMLLIGASTVAGLLVILIIQDDDEWREGSWDVTDSTSSWDFTNLGD